MRIGNSATAEDIRPNDLEAQFRAKLVKFSSFIARYDRFIEPYSHLTWTKFRTLSITAQQEAYNRFSDYYDLCVVASESGIPFNDDRSLTWWALQKFGLRPCSDFFDKLTKDHVLEVYNPEFVQIYRNWAFFEISSYSMGDLFVYPWPDLYVRESSVTANLIDHASMALSGSHKHTITCESPRHIVSEALSSGHNILDMELNYVSPLFDSSGATAAFFAVSTVTKIGSKDVSEKPKPLAPVLSLVES